MKTYQLIALYLLLAACYICHIEAEECDRNVGPAGTVYCIKSPRYNNDYQWATCRTDKYIRTKSKDNHECIDRLRIYCYYQCMIDVYGKESGTVLPHCKCSPGGPLPTEAVILPAWCYSPSGTSCTWYRECLNKAYPSCENDKDDYAVGFAETFCKLYDDSYNKFSPQGKRWVDAVRKCLQVKLVPLIDRTRTKTCADLKTTAFESHTPCYLNPDKSSLSYCDLSVFDKGAVFWTIKSSIFQAFRSSLKGLLDVRRGCEERKNTKSQEVKAKIEEEVNKNTGKTKTNSMNDIIQETDVRITVWLQNLISPIQLAMYINDRDWSKAFKRRKRSVTDDQEIARSQFAGKIIDAIALEERWQEKGVAWFAYANNDIAHNNKMSIRLLVADRSKYEGVDNTTLPLTKPPTKPANLAEILVQLSKDVLNGTLNLQINGEGVEIMKLNGCLDWDCEVHAFNITSLKSSKSDAVESHRAMHRLAYFVILFINFMFMS